MRPPSCNMRASTLGASDVNTVQEQHVKSSRNCNLADSWVWFTALTTS